MAGDHCLYEGRRTSNLENIAMNISRRVVRRGHVGWLLILLVGIAALWLWLQGVFQGDKAIYLALGDSAAVGRGTPDPKTQGYVARFHAFLTSALGTDLTLLNLAEDGATSGTLISNQLHVASQLLQAEGMKVAIVTLSIGGNDLFKLTETDACSGGGLTCIQAIEQAAPGALGAFAANFNKILADLRVAGGAKLPIIVMTYYNPLEHEGCQYHDINDPGKGLLEEDTFPGLNDLIRLIAAAHQVAVAELVPVGKLPGLLASSALTSDCEHPNEAGHAIIADAFKAASPPTIMISDLRSHVRSRLDQVFRPGPMASSVSPGGVP
jgi:lysophospholipase L1-like esterase